MEYSIPNDWMLPATDSIRTPQPPGTPVQPLVEISTPFATVISDSGSHWLDVSTVVGAILLIYIGKKLVDKLFSKTRENK